MTSTPTSVTIRRTGPTDCVHGCRVSSQAGSSLWGVLATWRPWCDPSWNEQPPRWPPSPSTDLATWLERAADRGAPGRAALAGRAPRRGPHGTDAKTTCGPSHHRATYSKRSARGANSDWLRERRRRSELAPIANCSVLEVTELRLAHPAEALGATNLRRSQISERWPTAWASR